jgi:hypothetical protein
MELTEHYRTEMALRSLPIRYETMVTRQAETVRSGLYFIDVPFDEDCLRFHENRRYARTVTWSR